MRKGERSGIGKKLHLLVAQHSSQRPKGKKLILKLRKKLVKNS